MATRSTVALSAGMGETSAWVPLVMRTRPIGVSETIEAMETPVSTDGGAKDVPMGLPRTSKASSLLEVGVSTSVNATRNPFVVAGTAGALGTWKSTSTTLEPTARKIWSPENGVKMLR